MKPFDIVVTLEDLTSDEGVLVPAGTLADLIEMYPDYNLVTVETYDWELVDCAPTAIRTATESEKAACVRDKDGYNTPERKI